MKKRFDRIYIEITNICNLSCPFCGGTVREAKAMSLQELEFVLSQVKPFTDQVCLHVLGEPLNYQYFEEAISLIRAAGLSINLVTNGYNIQKHLDIIMENISMFTKISFSLHAYRYLDNEAHDRLCAIFVASKALAENDGQIELRNLNSQDNDFERSLQDVAQKVLGVTIQDATHNQKLQEKLFYVVKKPFVWPKNSQKVANKNVKAKNIYCMGGRSHVAILSNLKVVPCCLDAEGDLAIGDMHDNNLSEILRQDSFLKMYTDFGNGKPNNEYCKHCRYNDDIKR